MACKQCLVLILTVAELAACGGTAQETAASGSGGAAGSADTGGNGGSSGNGGTAGAGTPCDAIAQHYQMAIERARICKPQMSSLQCTSPVTDGLPCGCETFVNPANANEMTILKKLLGSWETQHCWEGVLCEPCPPPPAMAFCETTPPGSSAPGLCVDDT